MADSAGHFQIPTDLEPRSALSKFIYALGDFLGELVHSNESPRGELLFVQELLPDIRGAWREVQYFVEPIAEAAMQMPEIAIIGHGLSGAQLRLKLNLINYLDR
jgi:hypothetical protein